jgi:hypothetical protein
VTCIATIAVGVADGVAEGDAAVEFDGPADVGATDVTVVGADVAVLEPDADVGAVCAARWLPHPTRSIAPATRVAVTANGRDDAGTGSPRVGATASSDAARAQSVVSPSD